MTQYTPGPWNYAGPSDIGRDTYSIYGNGPLAYTAGPSDYGDAAEANARLIAAAPDLLAALKQIMEWEGYDHEAGYYPDEDTEQRASEVWNDAKAAIAKATGQEVTQGNGSPR